MNYYSKYLELANQIEKVALGLQSFSSAAQMLFGHGSPIHIGLYNAVDTLFAIAEELRELAAEQVADREEEVEEEEARS